MGGSVLIVGVLFVLFSQSRERKIVPEVELNISGSLRGGQALMDSVGHVFQSKYPDTSGSTHAHGASEWVIRFGCSITQPVSEKLELLGGAHIGYAWGKVEGGLKQADASEMFDAEYLKMSYLLVDLQVGVRYWKWSRVALQSEVNIERGLFGSYKWQDENDVVIQEGGIGNSGESKIEFPMKFYVKFGPVFNVYDRIAVFPWLGVGKASMIAENGRLSNSSKGIYRDLQEDEVWYKAKFGLKIGANL